jgi:hypothetical protein
LGAVVSFVASGTASRASLGAAKILGPRKLLAAEVDHVVAGNPGSNVRTQFRDLYLNGNRGEDQESFEKIRRDHHPQGNQSEGSFARQTALRTRQCRPDGVEKLVPWRGPFNDQLGSVVNFDSFFDLESFNHAGGTRPSLSVVISILSPTTVPVSAAVRHGSSSTEAACVRTGAKRQGCRSL